MNASRKPLVHAALATFLALSAAPASAASEASPRRCAEALTPNGASAHPGRDAMKALAEAWVQLLQPLGDSVHSYLGAGLARPNPAESEHYWLEEARVASLPEDVLQALDELSSYGRAIAEASGLDETESLARLGRELQLRARELLGELGAAAETRTLSEDGRSAIPTPRYGADGPLGRQKHVAALPSGVSLHPDFKAGKVRVFSPAGRELRSIPLPASASNATNWNWLPVPLDNGTMALFFGGGEAVLLIDGGGNLRGTLPIQAIGPLHLPHIAALAGSRIAVFTADGARLVLIDAAKIGSAADPVIARTDTSGFHAGIVTATFHLVPRPDGSVWLARFDGMLFRFAADGRLINQTMVAAWENSDPRLGSWHSFGVRPLKSGRVAWADPAHQLRILDDEGRVVHERMDAAVSELKDVAELPDGATVVVRVNGSITCFNPDGSFRWKQRHPRMSGVVPLPDGRIAASVSRSTLNSPSYFMVLSPKDGETLGESLVLAAPELRKPLLFSNGTLLVIGDPLPGNPTEPSRLFVLDPGHLRERSLGLTNPIEIPLGSIGTAAEIADGRILFAGNGRIDWLDPALLTAQEHDR